MKMMLSIFYVINLQQWILTHSTRMLILFILFRYKISVFSKIHSRPAYIASGLYFEKHLVLYYASWLMIDLCVELVDHRFHNGDEPLSYQWSTLTSMIQSIILDVVVHHVTSNWGNLTCIVAQWCSIRIKFDHSN